jgi:hypothetical protein
MAITLTYISRQHDTKNYTQQNDVDAEVSTGPQLEQRPKVQLISTTPISPDKKSALYLSQFLDKLPLSEFS